MKNTWQQLKPHYQLKIDRLHVDLTQLKDLSIHLWLQMAGMTYN